MTAKAVERFMRGIVNFSSFSISYLTGGNTSKDSLSPAVQRFTLDLFRAGKVFYLNSNVDLNRIPNDILIPGLFLGKLALHHRCDRRGY
jgi:hypothetical protein